MAMKMLVNEILLYCNAVWTCRSMGLKRSSALKKEAVCSSETLISTYKSTWRYNPEDQNDNFFERPEHFLTWHTREKHPVFQTVSSKYMISQTELRQPTSCNCCLIQ
jgi:hypothetical protein